MARNDKRGRNNNPEGRNQYSGWTDTAKERPFTTAAAAAAAVGAGVFLWSRRNQISDQLTSLSDQISEWSRNSGWTSDGEFEMAGADSAYESGATNRSTTRSNRKSGTTGLSETDSSNTRA